MKEWQEKVEGCRDGTHIKYKQWAPNNLDPRCNSDSSQSRPTEFRD